MHEAHEDQRSERLREITKHFPERRFMTPIEKEAEARRLERAAEKRERANDARILAGRAPR